MLWEHLERVLADVQLKLVVLLVVKLVVKLAVKLAVKLVVSTMSVCWEACSSESTRRVYSVYMSLLSACCITFSKTPNGTTAQPPVSILSPSIRQHMSACVSIRQHT